jgi:hypothetical protein
MAKANDIKPVVEATNNVMVGPDPTNSAPWGTNDACLTPSAPEISASAPT